MSKCKITNSGKIENYLLNQLSNNDEKEILLHLLECEECKDKVDKLRKFSNAIVEKPKLHKSYKIWWIMAAASIAIIVCVVGYLYVNNNKEDSVIGIADNEITEVYSDDTPDYAEADYYFEGAAAGFKLISPECSNLNYSYISSEEKDSVITFKWQGVKNKMAVLILGNDDEILDKYTVYETDSIVVDISKYQQLEYIDWVLMVNDIDNMHEGKIIILK
ncbi:hypothetical protein LJC69_05075 [Bacteroidales bacterium OttesenSCG-928-K22]|nr:hypothetical protein [Bacteroidales bacterium OttesenSCG-928-K22]